MSNRKAIHDHTNLGDVATMTFRDLSDALQRQGYTADEADEKAYKMKRAAGPNPATKLLHNQHPYLPREQVATLAPSEAARMVVATDDARRAEAQQLTDTYRKELHQDSHPDLVRMYVLFRKSGDDRVAALRAAREGLALAAARERATAHAKIRGGR